MLIPANNPMLADFVSPPLGFELLRYTFYSRKCISAGAWPSETVFFSDQVGVGGATTRDTNMTKPAAMGNPRRFLMQWINCAIYSVSATSTSVPTSILDDVSQVLYQTHLRIELLDKEYLTCPTFHIPAGGGLSGATGVVATEFGTSGSPDKKNAYPVELPLEREASFAFRLRNAVTGGFTTSVDLYVEYLLTGLLLRPNQ